MLTIIGVGCSDSMLANASCTSIGVLDANERLVLAVMEVRHYIIFFSVRLISLEVGSAMDPSSRSRRA